jgi:hypothetical protein
LRLFDLHRLVPAAEGERAASARTYELDRERSAVLGYRYGATPGRPDPDHRHTIDHAGAGLVERSGRVSEEGEELAKIGQWRQRRVLR